METLNLKLEGNQKEVVIREGAANPVFLYDGFRYQANSTEAFISLVKAKANKDHAIVAYNEAGMHAILDDTIKDRTQDKVTYGFVFSQQYMEWGVILRENGVMNFSQKGFLDFLKRRDMEELSDLEELIASVQNFRYITSISGEASYEDGNNYVFGIKVKDVEGTTKLPKIIRPRIRIFNEADELTEIDVEIEIVKPRDAGNGLVFNLSCPKIKRYIKEAAECEVEKMKRELEGYLIVSAVLF